MVRTRLASVEDPDAHALLAEYFAIRAATFPGGDYRTVFPDPAAFAPGSGVFLLLDGDHDEAAGCGGIRRLSDRRYEVKHLYVRPAGRGRGWGRLILEELEQHARDAGAAELVLDTHHTLEAAASLYTRSGFESIEPYNENPNATRWYRKAL
ncbi:GNAT family N-acetyltransferase [Microbacterium sp. SORGH_AS_0888]|uniref:GNAT family N-acetyltransferase n=1 Tax=Microbacterium sp. SORGH_AS_0888 TaxID=3041791 RepID=UPI00278B3A28|nr:GNAT family N-acetyltransferase [Microbacterium sp. SORGH_AS_0888]MDQ1129102.1 ribosomal protein S18 acetylase RimI-like enzyme [Microbacterium sp. SORGH_AS_0888]